MQINTSSPWHEASYRLFVEKRLPELLSDRLPLGDYRVEDSGADTLTLHVLLSAEKADIRVSYSDIPKPDSDGIFMVDGRPWLVVPEATDEDLETADIECVGDQLHRFVDSRLGSSNGGLDWDASLVKGWLPLDKWFRDFFAVTPTAQPLDTTNWISRKCHLRRILLPTRAGLLHESHFGRVCPFETPEGPNIGRVLSVAVGAEIRDGKLLIVDDAPESGLGVTASMIPLLEHDDANRLLMGANMIRQSIIPPDPEPALVQTDNEPDASGFWWGRNLLTAYMSMGADTYEDSIVVSESCAQRLGYPHALEPGDKLSNRHGTKGTVSRILPDDQMPQLVDGTPVELVFSFIGCISRLNFGQIREAVLSRIAEKEGRPFHAPAFHAPSENQIRDRLRKAGLPVSGMGSLELDGEKLPRPTTVGWVYWGKLFHMAKSKLHASSRPSTESQPVGQLMGEMEYHALRDIGASEIILENLSLRSENHSDARDLADRVAREVPQQAPPPTPRLAELTARLSIAGIRADFSGEDLAFRFDPPAGAALELAQPVPHPWMGDRELSEIGAAEEIQGYDEVAKANSKVQRMIEGRMPDSLVSSAVSQLKDTVGTLFGSLLTGEHLRIRSRMLFSGRTVLSVDSGLHLDQIGIADEIAWALFGPAAIREMGHTDPVRDRTPEALRVLDEVMARSWIILNRAPTILPTSILAFHPIRSSDRTIRIHPLICPAMNADFDGDQAALFLPITETGQKEAGDLLSVAGHVHRDPGLFRFFCPKQGAVWGLAELSLRADGRREIEEILGLAVASPEGCVTRDTITDGLYAVMERDGIDAALRCSEHLTRRGFETIRRSGASISPFTGSDIAFPIATAGDDRQAWVAHVEECGEQIASRSDFESADIGPQLLAYKTMARGNLQQFTWLLTGRGPVIDTEGRPRHVIRRGLVEGMAAEEAYACVVGARKGLAQVVLGMTDARDAYGVHGLSLPSPPRGHTVLARAMRVENPGIVFANAAASGEVDPLVDPDSRLFVGLKP